MLFPPPQMSSSSSTVSSSCSMDTPISTLLGSQLNHYRRRTQPSSNQPKVQSRRPLTDTGRHPSESLLNPTSIRRPPTAIRPSNLSLRSLRLLFLLLSVTLIPITSATTSNQQSPEIKFNPEERQVLRGLFLKRFGLEYLTESIAQDEARSSPSLTNNRQMPAYLWELYEQAEEQQLETVRHYTPVKVVRVVEGEGDAGKKRIRLTYNLSATGRHPNAEMVLRADLRLPWPRASRSSAQGPLKMDLYEGSLLVDTRMVNLSDKADRRKRREGWMDFSATKAFWERPQEQGDMVNLILEFSRSDVSIRQLKASAGLIIYSESIEDPKTKTRRSRRAIPDPPSSTHKGLHRKHRKHRKHHLNSLGSIASSLCRRESLYVDFSELNWQDWILAPNGYDAYQCRGRCPHPLPAHLNTTNHAIIQSLIHSMDPNAAPTPCCVATETSAISILYKDVNNVVVVKTYPDMKVDSCGCH